jgi:mono/diheme cytochrome c family protein
MNRKQLWVILTVSLTALLTITACTSTSLASSGEPTAVAEEHQDEHGEHSDEHADSGGHTHSPEDHMEGQHNIPEEAAAAPNPLPASQENIQAGAQIFANNCAVCHGENGEGNGPAAESLEMKPANLHEDHVQMLTDGSLFFIISHGEPNTPMPAWDNILSESERWQVVHFLRTFRE